MATLRVSSNSSLSLLSSSGSSSSSSSTRSKRRTIKATLNAPKIHIRPISLPDLSTTGLNLMEELNKRGYTSPAEKDFKFGGNSSPSSRPKTETNPDPIVISKLYAIMEAVADRVEMHKNIGDQRDNWNRLLLTSINTITLTASTLTGIASVTPSGASSMAALKASSIVLYIAATGILCIMNKIQPSQLAEEQRNASRLFKQLYEEINTLLSIGNPTLSDVDEALRKVLDLDRAYPLPLLGVMLDKFPSDVKPAVWWPKRLQNQNTLVTKWENNNGWNVELEEEMREVAKVLKRKDKEEYLRLGNSALRVNKILAISGPLLTGIAAVGSAFVGSKVNGLAVMVGLVGGVLATIVNALEHGGQVGMVFEMYRSNAGFFKLMEETIESNVNERNVGRRENAELLEMKVALQLGRSLSELKELAANSTSGYVNEEFGSKLF